MSMKTVLLAIGSEDESRLEELTETAASVVDPNGRVVLLHVFDHEQYDAIETQLNIDPDSEVTLDDVARRSWIVSDVAEGLERVGVDYEIRGALGETAESILGEAGTLDADLVVVGGRTRSATGKALFGSTAQRVLLESDCPVTFVKGRPEERSEAAIPV
ncbi:MAG: universal stress protein UspA related nucleotide-binding protein [uncultured archaeon A07HR67]|jgi:Universal stress protein UspA and related nucleotide-binding proteins|nr:MAG: universal stress protein UspA related nucleotide-binding protein [uncultured archaeon A07HR67]